MHIILISIIALGALGIIGSIMLWGVSRRFHVDEDPKIGLIEQLLPGANCGGCGRSGCHDFARACAGASSLDNLICPASEPGTMQKIAAITGLEAKKSDEPKVAVIRCGGSCDKRTRFSAYDGPASCAVANSLGAADGNCPFGCLGCGDCVSACKWHAISIEPSSGLPVVDEDACTACGACVKACPRSIIELRRKGPRGMRIWVACSNREKGAAAIKECKAACIACGKCARTCSHDAITVSGNLAYIDPQKCRLCKKCIDICPTGAILSANFPPKKNISTTE